MSHSNGMTALKIGGFVLGLATIIFAAGGGWSRLQAQERRIESLEVDTSEDHDAIVRMVAQVENIEEDVGEIKTEQTEQRALLNDIYLAVGAGG